MPRTLAAITGASSGIGAAFARRLAAEHDLLLIARRKDRLEELASELTKQHNCHADILVADLTSDDGQAAVADRLQHEKELILLVNNAGFGSKGRFWESPLEIQDSMHRLHVLATVRLTHAALQNMVPKDRGGIINVASVAAFVRSPGTVSYAATKSWMTVFTEGLYLELKSARSQVIVQALCPGFTYSEFHDAMGASQRRFEGSALWMTAEYVVDQSLNGLARRQLFVIPNWRYRVITAFLSVLPSSLRIKVEQLSRKPKPEQLRLAKQSESSGRTLER